jgi:hypothetical protein
MKFVVASLAALTLFGAGAALADAPPPPPKTKLRILPLEEGSRARIEIPRAAVGKPTDVGGTPVQTIAAGMFLSLALAGGGLWMARRRGSAALGAAGVCLGLLAGGGTAYANLAPPRLAPPAVEVSVGVVTQGREILLYLTPEQLKTALAGYREKLPPGELLPGAAGAAPGAAPTTQPPAK